MSNAYKQAGVDIEAGYEAVNRMKKHVKRTVRPEVMGGLGGFGGMFDLSACGLKEPVLVSGTDGVGTKLKLAFEMDRHDTVGIDLVAMCVNDIVVQGAEPLYFLDYIACGKAEPAKIESIVKGISEGCVQAGCSLIGGETAEMPGMYQDGEYDLAGYVTGACEKSKLITGNEIKAGNVLIGLASSGVHSNGYSLVRKIIETNQLSLTDFSEELSAPLGDVLLTPTKIYVKSILHLLKTFKMNGMAHITGGGFIENIPRMLPEGLGVEMKEGSWPILPIFQYLQEKGQLDRMEMYNIFNMGIGFVLAVDAELAEPIMTALHELGEQAFEIGVVSEETGVEFVAPKEVHV
ncbi:phosphoribosylformylglycinamidine cyclo-ligase [Neobacillus sp. D3-1R]|uniref:phosphoribosylformylglycinamidine cyclo-ligase n=1 Tax=Neobacillus sp. D3-1R TaxID=3445778 RepID=UPI003F9F04A1